MTIQNISNFNNAYQVKNAAVFLAETPSDTLKQNFCKTEYKKYFNIDKLPDKILRQQNSILETLLKYGNEWRKELYTIRGQIARDKKRLSQTDVSQYPIAAQHDVEEINRYTERLNAKIDSKIQELLNFQVDCGGHLEPSQNAVIDEERRRLAGMKLKPKKIMSQIEIKRANQDINEGQRTILEFRKWFGRSKDLTVVDHTIWGAGILNGVRPVPVIIP